jgi:hypothetical protein
MDSIKGPSKKSSTTRGGKKQSNEPTASKLSEATKEPEAAEAGMLRVHSTFGWIYTQIK